jgi:hypothetical protein
MPAHHGASQDLPVPHRGLFDRGGFDAARDLIERTLAPRLIAAGPGPKSGAGTVGRSPIAAPSR